MEPNELPRSDDTTGFSRRRISSILKAPRKSTVFPDLEQKENVVECVRPAEKRSSRRVSFAPANDVLLFSKDVKNTTPTPSPLQELRTAAAGAATQHWVPGAEDGTQQMMAMETLLNAPLHDAQQQEKVHFVTGDGFGEKTVVFSSDDALMDMTHSQTVNLSTFGEFLGDTSLHHSDAFPCVGEKTPVFNTDDTSMDITLSHTVNQKSQKRNLSSMVPCMDPGFEDFLSSLSKPPSTAATQSVISVPQIKTQKADVDKENLLPPALTKKSRNPSDRTVDIRMNSTEEAGATEVDDPFQFLFSTQDMSNRRVTQRTAATKTSFDSKGTTSLKTVLHQKQKVNFEARDEKTITFCADDISPVPVAPQQPSADGCVDQLKTQRAELVKANMSAARSQSPGEPSSPETDAMDMTEVNTGRSIEMDSSDDPFSFLFPTQNMFPQSESGMKPGKISTQALGTSHNTGVDASLDPCVKMKPHRQQFDTENTSKEVARGHPVHISTDLKLPFQQSFLSCSDKTMRFNANDTGMDMTKCITVNIANIIPPESVRTTVKNQEAPCEDKTVRFNVHEAGMDMTQCLTVNIDTDITSESVPTCIKKEGGPYGDKTLRFNVHEASMDMTQCLTMNISNDILPNSGRGPVKIQEGQCRDKTRRFSANDAGMDMTQCLTVNIANDIPSELVLTTVKNQEAPCGDKTVRFNTHEAGMDMTQCLTVNIDADITPESVPTCIKKQEGPYGDKTVRFNVHEAGMDMTQCLTVNIANDILPNSGLGPVKIQEGQCGDKTMRFNANDAGMDMTQCLTVNIANNLSESVLGSVKNQGAPPRGTFLLAHPELNPSVDSVSARMSITAAASTYVEDSSAMCPNGDIRMDMTAVQTGHILGVSHINDPPQQSWDLKSRKSDQSLQYRSNDAHGGGPPRGTASLSVALSSDSGDCSPEGDVNMDMTEVQTECISGVWDALPSQGMQTGGLKSRKSGMTSHRRSSIAPSSVLYPKKTQQGCPPSSRSALAPLTITPSYDSGHCGPICPEGDLSMDMTEVQTGPILGCLEPLPTQGMQTGGLKSRKSEMTSRRRSSAAPSSFLYPEKTQQGGPPKGRSALAPLTVAPSSDSGDCSPICPDGDVSMDMTEVQTGCISGVWDTLPSQGMQTGGLKSRKSGMTSHHRSSTAPSSVLYPKKTQQGGPPSSRSALAPLTITPSYDSGHCGPICPEGDLSMDMTEVQTGPILGCLEPLPTQGMQTGGLKSRKSEMTSHRQSSAAPSSFLYPQKTQQGGPPRDRAALAPLTVSPSSDSGDCSPICPDGDISMDLTEARTGRILGVTHVDDPLSSQHQSSIAPCSVLYSLKTQEGGTSKGRSSSVHNSDPELSVSLKQVSNISNNVNTVSARMMSTVASFNSGATNLICAEGDVSMDMTEVRTGQILGVTHLNDPPLLLTQGTQSGVLKDRTSEMTLQLPSSGDPPKSRPSLAHNLDPGFKGFPTKASSINSVSARMALNIASPSDSGDSVLVCPDGDINMDMTEVRTGRILGITHMDDVPWDLLPTKGTQSSVLESRKSVMTLPGSGRPSLAHNLDPRFIGFPAEASSVSARRAPSTNFGDTSAVCPEGNMRMVMNEVQKRQISGVAQVADVPQSERPKDKCGPTGPISTSAHSLDPEFNGSRQSCTTGDFKTINPDGYVDMTKTEVETGCILGITRADDPSQCPPQTQDTSPVPGSSTCEDMEKSLTAKMEQHQVVIEAEDECGEEPAATNVIPCFKRISESNLISIHRRTTQTSRSLAAQSLGLGFRNSSSLANDSSANNAVSKETEAVDGNRSFKLLHIQKSDVDPDFIAVDMENMLNKTTTQISKTMDVTEVQTGGTFGLTSTNDSDPNSDTVAQKEATSQLSDIQSLPHPSNDHEIIASKEPEARNENCSSQTTESPPCAAAAIDQNADALHSRKSRRKSLADLQSKVRRLSRLINAAPDAFATESSEATPAPQSDHELEQTKSMPLAEPEVEMELENPQDKTQDEWLIQEGEASAATPHNLKSKLMSRLSIGAFKPKLPQRIAPNDPKCSFGEHTRRVNVTNQLGHFDNDVSNIYDEELGSYEDNSETLNTSLPREISEQASRSHESHAKDVFEEGVFSAVTKKRPLLRDEDDNKEEDDKRMKPSMDSSDDIAAEEQQNFVESDGNSTAAPNTTTHTTNYSSSSSSRTHTASIRGEATFESTFEQTMFESTQDYTKAQKKFEDSSITVSEFLKFIGMDFVIHNPKRSVFSGTSESDRTEMDRLMDAHIHRPKQMVYEVAVRDLTEKLEGLEVRRRDLDKPLKMVNQTLWEELRTFTEEELKSFGSSLKERNHFFRKTAKARSNEMKEVLYTNLVQANLEEQQKLRGKIAEADDILKSLDDCISQLQSELSAIEETGLPDGKQVVETSFLLPSLTSQQEEMKRVTQALADNKREMSELELQNKQNSSQIQRLKTQTKNLEEHVSTLEMLNEWKFGENGEHFTTYTFLHNTLHLQLHYEKSNGNEMQPERKITDIIFKPQLDVEKSPCHTHLVHKLVSQFIESESSWVKKYPTNLHITELLHDVALVVGMCRLLGEELLLLKKWGALKLDILDLSCVDTQVTILFSSLRKSRKFKAIFSISLMDCACVVQLQSCENIHGDAAIDRIKDIVASFTPGRNVFTKIVKKIHEDFLI